MKHISAVRQRCLSAGPHNEVLTSATSICPERSVQPQPTSLVKPASPAATQGMCTNQLLLCGAAAKHWPFHLTQRRKPASVRAPDARREVVARGIESLRRTAHSSAVSVLQAKPLLFGESCMAVAAPTCSPSRPATS